MPECVMEQACAVEEQHRRHVGVGGVVGGGGGGGAPVYLEPFLHQVGGHSSMLRFDDTTVCKPLIPREQYFYETMPEEMKEFTPQYRGVTKVAFAEDSDGYLTLVAYPLRNKTSTTTGGSGSMDGDTGGGGGGYLDVDEQNSEGGSPASGGEEGTDSDSESSSSSSSSSPFSCGGRQRFRICRSGSIEMETSKSKKSKVHNPWYLRCYKVQLEKMRKSGSHKFILLENLASDYKWPCILDLKMGTRQHGDDASEEKRLLHTQKCAVSTSSTLGTRLCGMQSYQASTGQYICRDKYYGRTLSVEGMRDTLFQFLHNGYMLRHDILEPLLSQLRRLHHVLSLHHTFRFYSSSLLIMYDGGDWTDNITVSGGGSSLSSSVAAASAGGGSVAGHSVGGSGGSGRSDDGADNCNMCRDHVMAAAAGSATATRNNRHVDEDDDDSLAYIGEEEVDDDSMMMCDDSDSRDSADNNWYCPDHHKYQLHNHHNHNPPKVDIRMIDFAHVTHQGFRGDSVVHHGPDHGYLFGLENLIHMFEDIKRRGERGNVRSSLSQAPSTSSAAHQ